MRLFAFAIGPRTGELAPSRLGPCRFGCGAETHPIDSLAGPGMKKADARSGTPARAIRAGC